MTLPADACPAGVAPAVVALSHVRLVDGVLTLHGVALPELMRRFGTPLFVFDAHSMEAQYRAIDAALAPLPHRLAYAVKANDNLSVLRRLERCGAGADIVSGGELQRALKAGMAPEHIVFSGVGKRADEIGMALDVGIRSLHVESEAELEAIAGIAARRGARARVSLRLNPNVDAQTHPYIATGMWHAKFGLSLAAARALVPRIVQSPHLELTGVTCHIGSQLGHAAPWEQAAYETTRFACDCLEAGAPLSLVDVGGGWPVAYGDESAPPPSFADCGAAIVRGVQAGNRLRADFVVWTEPGRALVAGAGLLLTEVLYCKERLLPDGQRKRFIIVDAAMTELIRPALYQAHHAITPMVQDAPTSWSPADVVGPVCESADFLAKDR
ncbi:MAG: diaminopimelate decarboxylase, partial [Polyangiales bacterium]